MNLIFILFKSIYEAIFLLLTLHISLIDSVIYLWTIMSHVSLLLSCSWLHLFRLLYSYAWFLLLDYFRWINLHTFLLHCWSMLRFCESNTGLRRCSSFFCSINAFLTFFFRFDWNFLNSKNFKDKLNKFRYTLAWVRYLSKGSVMMLKLCNFLY